MKHLEQPKKPVLRAEEKSTTPSSVSKFKLFLIGMVLVTGIGRGMTALWNASLRDNVSDVRKSELEVEFSRLKAIKVERVGVADRERALNSMHLSPNQLQLLKNELSLSHSNSPQKTSTAQTDLVWLSLWDFAAPDGDIVHLTTAGYALDVLLHKIENRIAVPVDVTKTVKILGVRDGGGGITLGVKNGEAVVSMPVLQAGQTLSLPLSY